MEARVLDLFAGTGALALEALSRGAREAVLVEKSSFALGLIKKNINLCGFSEKIHVVRHDLLKDRFFLSGRDELGGIYDLIFLDPPYRQKSCQRLVPELLDYGIIAPDSIVVCEDASSQSMPDFLADLKLYDQRRYGDTGFWFYHL
jgi:16S rRNA (guanine966-N2)-methyltransferase